jgi:hypothetical protein
MFGWYRQSQVCYAYLSDFTLDTTDDASQQDQFEAKFRQCRWFTRGWCLQELLAPGHLRFFSPKWRQIGAKSSLCRLISDITGVPEAVLHMSLKKDIQDFPIAARISWIAKRHTTRIEDMSYSLLGILDVNMPMLYGEGEKAFLRLQEEIIKRYNDLSIFAWNGEATASGFMPILAAGPSSFAINPIDHQSSDTGGQLGDRLRTQFFLTNQGVFFPNAELQYQIDVPGYRHHYLLSLNYQDPSFRGVGGDKRYILLQKISPGLFVRLHDPPDRLEAFQEMVAFGPFFEPVCILNSLLEPMIPKLVLWERYAVRLRWKPWGKFERIDLHIRLVEPRESWDVATSQFLLEIAYERHMHILFVPGTYESNPSSKYFVLVIQVGDGNKRDPATVSVRIVNADVWQGINVTMLGLRGKEGLELQELPPMNGDSDHISFVGYDISVSVRLMTEPNEQPYHLLYLDWEANGDDEVTGRSRSM